VQLLKGGHEFNTRESTGGIAHCGILGPQRKRFWVQTQWRAGETPASQPPLPLMSLTFGDSFYTTSCQVASAVVCFKRKEKKRKEKKKKKENHHHQWMEPFLPWMNFISLVTS
jgi:hypothetical protein